MLDRLGRPPSMPVVIPAGHRISTVTEQGRHRDGPVASRPEALTISALALPSGRNGVENKRESISEKGKYSSLLNSCGIWKQVTDADREIWNPPSLRA